MTSHWPILVGVAVVAGAVMSAVYQREELVHAAQVQPVPKPLPTSESRRQPMAGVRNSSKVAEEATPVNNATPVPTAKPMPAGAQKQKGVPVTVTPGTGALFADLRSGLKAAFQGARTLSANSTAEAFSMAVDGARIEMLETAEWSIAQ